MKWMGFFSVVLLASCVSSGKYNELETKHGELLAKHQKLEADYQSTLQSKDSLSKDLKNKDQNLSDTTRQVEAAQLALEDQKRMIEQMEKNKKAAEARVAEYRNLLDRFKTMIEAGKLKVKMSDGRMVVELPNDVLFPSGSAKLSKEGEDAVKEVATLLSEIPDKSFQIEGHTDNKPIRSAQFRSNWVLASARALTVLNLMKDSGMDVRRLSAASYADVRPVGSNDDAEGRTLNRRIEIVVVPDLSLLPGSEELQEYNAP